MFYVFSNWCCGKLMFTKRQHVQKHTLENNCTLCCIALFYTQAGEKLHPVKGKKFEGAICKIWPRHSVERVSKKKKKLSASVKKWQNGILETCVGFKQNLQLLACQQTTLGPLFSKNVKSKSVLQIASHTKIQTFF